MDYESAESSNIKIPLCHQIIHLSLNFDLGTAVFGIVTQTGGFIGDQMYNQHSTYKNLDTNSLFFFIVFIFWRIVTEIHTERDILQFNIPLSMLAGPIRLV